MAKDTLKNAQTEFQNLGNTLAKVQADFEKTIQDSVKQTSKISGGWKNIGKHIVDSLKGLKSIELLEKKIEAGKTASKKLDDVVKNGLEVRRKISTELSDISKEMNTLSAGMGEKALPAMTDVEKERWQYLNYQKSSLERQATLQGNQIRSAIEQRNVHRDVVEQQEKDLAKKKKSLEVVNTILQVLTQTKDIILAIIKAGERYDKVLMDAAYEIGVGRIEIEKYVTAINKAVNANMALGATTIDGYKAANQLTNQFELMSVQLQDGINQQMLVMNKAFGVSLDESAKFFGTLTQVGNVTLSSQQNMIGVADAAAKAAGVPLGKVLKDVSNLSNSVRLIFKGNTAELIKQAAEARKLGSSLDSAARSAEKLLDFESSITSELKLSALMGRNVNFNESRRLFFAGKVLEGEKALIRELERIGDINNLNYLERKELSNLVGKDFSELQKIQTQRKQQLELESKFPEVVEERKRAEAELVKILGSESEQKKRALEIQARDNIANTRRNVLSQMYEQILINISRALQPLYRILTDIAEKALKLVIIITDWIAEMSALYPKLSIVGGAIGLIIVGVVGLTIAIGSLIAIFAGLSVVGIEVSAFLTEIGFGLAAFGAGGIAAVPIILSIAAALAAVGVAGWGIGKMFEGIAFVIKSVLDPIVNLIDVVLKQFNVFTANIGTTITSIASGVRSISEIGFTNIAKAATGIYLFAKRIDDLSLSLLFFPIKKFNDFIEKISNIEIGNLDIFNKISKIIEISSLNGGNIDINLNIDESILTRLENLTKKPIIFLQDGIIDILNKTNTVSLQLSVEKPVFDLINKLTGSSLNINLQKDALDIFDKIKNNSMTLSLEKASLDVLSNFGGEAFNTLTTSVESIPEEARKFSIEISDDTKESIDKLVNLKDVNQDLKNTIQEGDNKIVASLQQLINLMLNGSIAVNLDGQLVSRTLDTTAYRSGGFGQSTTRT